VNPERVIGAGVAVGKYKQVLLTRLGGNVEATPKLLCAIRSAKTVVLSKPTSIV